MGNETKGMWVADIRVGCIAIHEDDKDKFNCLDGMSKQCVLYKDGYSVYKESGEFVRWVIDDKDVANAELIVEAINGCKSVNQSNPLVVAENITEMVEALKSIVAEGTRCIEITPLNVRANYNIDMVDKLARFVLNKISEAK